MLLRPTVRALGLGARPLLNAFILNPAPRSLKAAVSTLPPPWQPEDLGKWEKKAFDEHGPDYLDHLDETHQRKALRGVTKREAAARMLANKLGPDWYDITKEADRRFDIEVREPVFVQYQRRLALLGPVVKPSKPPKEHRLLYEEWDAVKVDLRKRKQEFRLKVKKERESKTSEA